MTFYYWYFFFVSYIQTDSSKQLSENRHILLRHDEVHSSAQCVYCHGTCMYGGPRWGGTVVRCCTTVGPRWGGTVVRCCATVGPRWGGTVVRCCATVGPRWGRTVVRCCATILKVAGSIPVGVSGFFIDIKSLWLHYGPGVDSASNRNEYQE